MSQVLYRKYRPKTFEEVEGQEHVVQTLKGALSSGRVGHAYLFCGPRGTGKTTMARILAKALNCEKRVEGIGFRVQAVSLNPKPLTLNPSSAEPCNACFSCSEINDGKSLDLIEIDAASNRGIDEIRNLKDSAHVAATGGRYKIFIVDECHMLTKEADNALLKLLEEPPAHVIFILATTEPHKLLDTVLSRVQRFDFKKISSDKIQTELREIAKKEKLEIDNDALLAIASSASGSLRDAESSLNKLISYSGGKITDEHVAEALGIVPAHVHQRLLELIRQKQTKEAVAYLTELHENGADIDQLTKQFIKYLRSQLVESIKNQPVVLTATQVAGDDHDFLIKAINLFVRAGSEIRFSPVPQLPVELAILELTKISH